jgi:hypothetical protein
MSYLQCSACGKKCPYKKSYFSTTQYDGVLCSNDCCIVWIIRQRTKKIKPKKMGIHEGTIKIVYTKKLYFNNTLKS